MGRHVFVAALLLGVLAVRPVAAAPFVFDTLPADGLLAAAPGETVGWGYTITNPSDTLWLWITSLSADPVQQGTIDTSVFDFIALPPLATVVRPFDAAAMLGLASFVWDAGASAGAFNAGVFLLDGAFYDGDPFGGGLFVEAADPAGTGYRVDLQSVAAVPEPGTLVLVVSGAALLLTRCRRRVAKTKGRLDVGLQDAGGAGVSSWRERARSVPRRS